MTDLVAILREIADRKRIQGEYGNDWSDVVDATGIDKAADLLERAGVYEVKCARCGKEGYTCEFVVEEGDEWECPPCNERCNMAERAEVETPHALPKYAKGDPVHLNRWPEPGPRQEENAGWIVSSIWPQEDGSFQYNIDNVMGGVTTVEEYEIAYKVGVGLAVETAGGQKHG